MKNNFTAGNLFIEANGPFFLIAGPCVMESESSTLEIAAYLRKMGEKLQIPIIFKSSYDKANRTSLGSYRGPGIDKGLQILQKVREEFRMPVLSDVHCNSEVEKAAQVLDVIQIPAFLCRQTDLIVNVAKTGVYVNIKKGQFISPREMGPITEKAISAGNRKLLITERGFSFGYNNLVVDMRSLVIMSALGFPIIFDATHSVQLPGGAGTSSGGQREFVDCLAKAAVAAGANGVFMEVHPDPDCALCDGPNSMPLKSIEPLVKILKQIHSLVRL
ncbi:MAG: 3-deoxy-8-phosphooctulonate synthase [Deltaproteobacteria bacterium]|nr:3-deoxy-8-phosphooctulonate synthase [Deltaproteobacteria bacterium]